jgi:hypothetical protein
MSEWVLYSGKSPTSMTRVFLGGDTGCDPSSHDWLLALPQGMVPKVPHPKMAPHRLVAKISTDAHWQTCFYPMAPMPITSC